MTQDRALLVGRFQPLHRGHLHAITAAARSYRFVAVGVGSAQQSHEPDNPFTLAERVELLTAAFREESLENVHLYPLPDLHDHARWVTHVEGLVPPFDVVLSNNPLTVRLFRAAGYPVKPVALWKPESCSGTIIRDHWRQGRDADALLPPAVAKGLRRLGGAARVRHLGMKA